MYGYELPVTDASKPNKQIYQKCSATDTMVLQNAWSYSSNNTFHPRRPGSSHYSLSDMKHLVCLTKAVSDVLEHHVMFKNNNTMNRSIILDVKK
jgi:hypothetical protein